MDDNSRGMIKLSNLKLPIKYKKLFFNIEYGIKMNDRYNNSLNNKLLTLMNGFITINNIDNNVIEKIIKFESV